MIKLMRNREGLHINVSPNNPDYGCVRIAEERIGVDTTTGFASLNKYSTLIKGEIEILQKLVNSYGETGLPGKLVRIEFDEDNIPEVFENKVMNKKISLEDNVQNYAKRNPSTGAMLLTAEGLRICAYTIYDATGTLEDVLVAHDKAVTEAAHAKQTKGSRANFAK